MEPRALAPSLVRPFAHSLTLSVSIWNLEIPCPSGSRPHHTHTTKQLCISMGLLYGPVCHLHEMLTTLHVHDVHSVYFNMSQQLHRAKMDSNCKLNCMRSIQQKSNVKRYRIPAFSLNCTEKISKGEISVYSHLANWSSWKSGPITPPAAFNHRIFGQQNRTFSAIFLRQHEHKIDKQIKPCWLYYF